MKRAVAIGAGLLLALAGGTVAVAEIGSGDEGHAEACRDAEKPGGDFGRCVSERASRFGRCVSEASQAGEENPDEGSCAHLKPSPGSNGEGEDDGERGDDGEAGQDGDRNPTRGVDFPPEADGREFGRQVSELARGNGGPPEGTPQDPPAGTPQGPPAGTPQGPPAGTPQGPPAGTPQGPPAGTPQGPPAGTPQGPPEGVPQGPPEGVGPGGPPTGVPPAGSRGGE